MRVALVLAIGFASCGGGESKCQKFRDIIRPQLLADFGVQPSQIDCSDSKWDTDDCQQCVSMFASEFGVEPDPIQTCEEQ
jgi:hypothetical protein